MCFYAIEGNAKQCSFKPILLGLVSWKKKIQPAHKLYKSIVHCFHPKEQTKNSIKEIY